MKKVLTETFGRDEMFYIAGRKIKVVTGKNTQTINICTETNTDGVYDYILRLNHPFLTEDILREQQFPSILRLIEHLKENYQANIEKVPNDETIPNADNKRGSRKRPSSEDIKDNFKYDLVERYWLYQQKFFPQIDIYFERPYKSDGRPPVFVRKKSYHNVILKPNASEEEKSALFQLVPDGEKHRWYGSMNSSQALAQSILGNLFVYEHIALLTELLDDSGESLFGDAKISSDNFSMEYKVNYLGEPRPTSLDGFISGNYQVAIESKFTEAEVGSCSRPRLTLLDSNYETDYCDGTYTNQRNRKSRCTLSEIGVQYWKYIPYLFNWRNDIDHIPCCVNLNYQLVRNVLAACVRPGRDTAFGFGHAILLYDERNPAFQTGGKGLMAFEETQKALRIPDLLRKCSWQRICNLLRKKSTLPWLTEQLELKYGL
jgi:hypothetical protein